MSLKFCYFFVLWTVRFERPTGKPKKKTPAVHEIALNNPVARARVWLGPFACGLNQHVIPGPADWSGGKCCYAQRKDIFLLMNIFLLPLSSLEETNIYYPIIGFV